MRRPARLAALLLTACADPTAPRSDVLTVRARFGLVELTNRTDERVYFAVAERAALPLLDPNFCERTPTCDAQAVAPRGTRVLRSAQIVGYRRPGEAVVLHWRLRPREAGVGFVPDSVRRVSVALR